MQLARQKISDLLEQTIGLRTSSLGATTLERAVRSRMRVVECESVDSYLERLSSSLIELRRLVEEVVVPETWFFRDQEPFTFLARYVTHSGKDLTKECIRILSLPCSTGEEPYSIAMTLLQEGVAPSSFYIDAVDVSERVLARARLGVYGSNSFRTGDLSFRDVFFTRKDEGYVLQQSVRDKVRFIQGNIIQPGFMASLGRYDVVFCRNVLIYFNEEAQKQSVESLHQALLTGGILFAGHAEAGIFSGSRLFSVAHAKAFAFRRQEPPRSENWRTVAGTKAVEPEASFLPRPGALRKRMKSLPPLQPSGASAPEAVDFPMVKKLADQGRLEEAARLSEEHLRRHGPAAEWYYLLGIILDSMGRAGEAMKLLRKAVYLDPGNVESLVHLALLAERAGDHDGAANFRRRIRKLQEEGEKQCRKGA